MVTGTQFEIMTALEDLQTRVDHLTMLSVMAGETLSTLVETMVENRVEEDALQVQDFNIILPLETAVRKCDWSVAKVPANIRQAINDLYDEMSQKASDKDLENILEFMQEGASANPGQGTGVQFLTPLRNADKYISMNHVPSGREMMDSETLSNQDSNRGAGAASGNSMLLNEEIKVLELQGLLNKLKDEVYGSGGSGYTFEGKPVRSQLDVTALLEKELPSKYVLVSCFMCPYILLDLVYHYVYDELTQSVSDRTKCDDQRLELFNFWAGEAKQKNCAKSLSFNKNHTGGKLQAFFLVKVKNAFSTFLQRLWR